MDPKEPQSIENAKIDILFKKYAKEQNIRENFSWPWTGVKIIFLIVVLFLSHHLFLSRQIHFGEITSLVGLHHAWIMPIHEGGHVVLLPLAFLPSMGNFNKLLITLGGSGAQIILPLCILIFYFKKKKYLVCLFALWWIGLNLVDVSMYMERAVDKKGIYLSLLGNIDENPAENDWSYIFKTLGILDYYSYLASFTYWLGDLVMLISMAIYIYYCIYWPWKSFSNLSD